MKKLLLNISLIIGTIAAYTSCSEQEQTPEIIKVESVSIDQEDMTLTEGESVTLAATVLPKDAADKTIAWSSSNDDVVMIASNGKARAIAVGEATITAKSGEQSDFIAITVVAKTIPVTGISLNPASITMKVGESQTVTAVITPQDATNKTVTWVSSNPEVASVDKGSVFGLMPGSVTITATTEEGAKTADCTVTVKSNLSPSVTVDADHISAVSVVLHGKANLENSVSSDLMVGFQYSTSSGILPSNSVTIEASEADSQYNYSAVIAELNPSTKYYYRSVIRQNGTDTYGETKEFTTKDVTSMLETRDASDIEATKATLNAKLDLTDVKYESLAYGFYYGQSKEVQNNDFKCTEIKDNAIFAAWTGLPHKTQYWYKAYVIIDSHTFIGEVKTFTTSVVSVESVSLDMTECTFHNIGNILLLTATVLPSDATDNSLEWISDNTDVATVAQNGVVKAIGNGVATITVTTKDQGKTATCVITVSLWVTGISLDKTSITLNEGQEQTLTATVNPSNAADKSLNWVSSDTSVATVNAEGKVTAVSKGTATIKAEAKDGSGVFASCAVRVKEPYTAVAGEAVDLGLSVKWSSTNLGATSPSDYGDYFAWGETSPKDNYGWSTYELCNGSSSTLTKYNNSSSNGAVDNKSEFKDYGYEDDAARQALGGKWRVPTDAEWTELQTKCTWTWTTNYNGTGVKGRIVTAPNGKSIFLPAAGRRDNTSLYSAGSYGRYWSSSLYTDNPIGAWDVYFFSDYVDRGSYSRCYGRSVRPVTE